jgi:quercetin dioxygenase-like cupin family protein
MPRKKSHRLVPIGKKIKKARIGKKVTFNNLANETGFSIEYLKDVEVGKVIPPVGAILQISRALKIDSDDLLAEQESTLKSRVKDYTKRTENYAYTTLTPGAENKHLKAFKVNIEALKEHKGAEYQHEGEEFVYVLSGQVEITVGEHVNKLKDGDALHFNSAIRHRLKNIGKSEAVLIVVLYVP